MRTPSPSAGTIPADANPAGTPADTSPVGTEAAGSVLEIVLDLARARTVGALIDRSMTALERVVASSLVSFNRMDLASRSATVALRPYRAEHEAAVDGVSRLLDEHPLYHWYVSQPDWSPARISDVVPIDRFRAGRLFAEVLEPIGACYTVVVLLTPPTSGEWIFFAANRADRDFTDDELALCTRLQPGLVALYARFAHGDGPGAGGPVTLTRREQIVLGHLAGGQTADAIARRLSTSPGTVRKHLQNIYAKLGTSDRLGAVIRGRDLGLLRAEDLSRELTWNVRADLRDVFPVDGRQPSPGD